MDRNRFLGHLALAVTLILLAAFAGQVKRWQNDSPHRFERQRRRAVLRSVIQEQRPRAQTAEVLVKFRPGTSPQMIRNIAFRHHDILEDSIESVDGLAVLRDEDGLTAEEVAEEYNSIKGLVEYAEPNYEITLDRDPSTGTRRVHPNDERFSDQWSLSNSGQNGGTNNADISALLAWAKSKGSEDVVVAVLDSGVDYRHPDLIGNMWHRPDSVASYSDSDLGEIEDFRGFNAVYKDGDPMDDNGHGTHCAGIIGAEGGNEIGITGINWHVQIMPLKFMDANGSGTTKAAIEAINYVIDRKQAGVNVRIISASWGSTIKSKALEDAIRKAGEEGILFVAAAGNSSEDSDKRPHFPAGYDLPNMISVAATDREDNLAPFSNWGLKSVHIAAPGKEILSTWLNGEFREASGTSMATPEVAGVAALVLSSESDLSVKQLRERLFTSVDKLPSLKGKVASGGRLNAARALGAE